MEITSNRKQDIPNLYSNLFGNITPSESNENQLQQNCNGSSVLYAAYPCIVDEAFSLTMDCYRKYISEYNNWVKNENLEINKWNATQEDYTTGSVSAVFSEIFLRKYKNLAPKQYNLQVQNLFDEKNIKISKRKIQFVKYQTELLFSSFISAYNSQLIHVNAQYMRLKVEVKRPVANIKINSWFITQMKRNGVQALNICGKTVRNHRDRLVEAGVLINKQFRGTTHAVEYQINPEILNVLEFKTQKLTSLENQQLNLSKGKDLPDNDVNTRTFKKEIKRTENEQVDFLLNRSSGKPLTIVYFGTRTPARIKNNETGGGGDEKTTHSTVLLATLDNEQSLAEKLNQNEFINYKSIDIRMLYNEAHSGTLSNEEFRQIVIQDFFKQANKLWSNHQNVYVGSWKLAINQYLKHKFMLHNGNPMQKVYLIEKVQELRWRLEYARKWFIKNEHIKTLYPNDYFDPTRKKSFEIGFEYTQELYKNYIVKLQNQGVAKAKQEAKAKKRALTYKFNAKVKQFFKDKITWEQLATSIKANYPKEFYDNLTTSVNKLRKQEQAKQSQVEVQKKILPIQLDFNEYTC
ncbi:hypothetical protein [Flavobacterium facile]|uniref:hypothetical protein n=1 Tax=Flavobacterium facile TaxID=2893174 RepID=UPI002E792A52|nr:hypothetical protein [Flavobacterium sp. T-12]